MRIYLSLCISLMFFSEPLIAQLNTYIVTFSNKNNSPYSLANPEQYLSQRAIERRTRYDIPIDSTDLPINPQYLDSLRVLENVSILNGSKWLNQVAIRTTNTDAVNHISNLPFVLSVNAVAPRVAQHNAPAKPDDVVIDMPPVSARETDLNGYYQYGKTNGQVKLHHTDFLHNLGFRGKGMMMCILDGGFFHYQTLPTFDSIRINNQILGTWDFVDREESVNEDNSHGMQCLSTIAANLPGVFVGTAPESNFYLFRTEDVGSEYPIEEQNLASGWERADSLGVDVCSISLGYTQYDVPALNHTYTDMNGHTTIAARAANLASQKGMLIVVAMGNDGNNAWHYLGTPADAEKVMSVGAVDTLGVIGSFSSYGPNSSGQVKPDVSATGVYAVVANTSTGLPSYGFGTSFACPIMAGISTCLWQAFPEYSNSTIIETFRESSSQFAAPDDRKGYGIPDAKQAFVRLQKMGYTRQSDFSGCNLTLDLRVKTDPQMTLQVERKLSTDVDFINVTSLQQNLAWGYHQFEFSENAGAFEGTDVSYRIIMQIGTDTTYILDTFKISVPANLCNSSSNPVTIHPNPVKDDPVLQLWIQNPGTVSAILYNAAGQKLYSRSGNLPAGVQNWGIPMKNLPAGAYVIRVVIGNKSYSRKLIKD